MKVSPPPIIYNGKLSGKQKEQLTDFLTTEWDDLFIKFKTESFTSYIISILNSKLKNTALNIGTTKPIEGIVFSFNDGGTFINAKVVDPLYTQSARNKTKNRYTPEAKENNSNLKEILSDMIGFIKTKGTYELILKGKTKDSRYVEALSELFLQYYQKNKSKFSKIEAHGGDVKELDVNYKFIPNKELQSILKSKPKVKRVFKLFLNTFGKTRNRATNTIDKSMLGDIGTITSKVKRLAESSVVSKMESLLNSIVNLTTLN